MARLRNEPGYVCYLCGKTIVDYESVANQEGYPLCFWCEGDLATFSE